jgi:hypothetical protein
MRFRLLAVLAIAALLSLGAAVRADYTFQFADSSGAAQNSFSVNVGQTVDIRVYILETGGGTTLQSSGLSAAGVKLNTNQPSIANVTAVTANSAFTGGSSTSVANASINEASGSLNPGVTAPSSGAFANRILVGTFTFTGVSSGQTLTVTALPGSGADNVLGDGTTIIDSNLANNPVTAVITVAVPEPGTLVLTSLLAVGGAAGAAWRRYRRRTA